MVLFVGFFFTSCADHVKTKPSRKTAVIDSTGDRNNKIDEKDLPITCEVRWQEFSQLMPQGRFTKYEEIQTSTIKGSTITLVQSITEKKITKNTPEQISWTLEVDNLAPDVGHNSTQTSLTKLNFIERCSQGITQIYSDRPAGIKAKTKEEVTYTFEENEIVVWHEVYNLAKGKNPSDKDEVELWVGKSEPYAGLVFKRQRRFFRVNPTVSENIVLKQLKEVKNATEE